MGGGNSLNLVRISNTDIQKDIVYNSTLNDNVHLNTLDEQIKFWNCISTIGVLTQYNADKRYASYQEYPYSSISEKTYVDKNMEKYSVIYTRYVGFRPFLECT